MRWPGVVVACLLVAACSKAQEAGQAGEATTSASGVAFAYRYDFRLPASGISEAQELQSQACERLGPAQCRITGMTFRLDAAGQANASLDVQVAAPLARAFGRRGVQAVERAGGLLAGAEIVGTDTAEAISAAQRGTTEAGDDLADLDRQLARADLPVAMRSELLRRRADLIAARRQNVVAKADAQASVATTPIHFGYAAGTGVGLTARLAEAAGAAYASLTWTLVTALTILAYLGPPGVVLVLLLFLWDRFGRRWWGHAFPPRAHEDQR